MNLYKKKVSLYKKKVSLDTMMQLFYLGTLKVVELMVQPAKL